MADHRVIHAVLLDAHGVVFDYEVTPPSRAPGLRRSNWARWTEEVLAEAGAPAEAIERDRLDPLTFWKRRMEIELALPRERRTAQGQKIVPERRFQEQVNVALLSFAAPSFLRSLSDQDKMRLARKLWRKRRTDQQQYVLHEDMRRLLGWLESMSIYVHLITAQGRSRAIAMLERCDVPRNLFFKLHTSGDIGLPKSHPAFWKEVSRRTGFPPEEVFCIDDRLSSGVNALKAGMVLGLCDRDGAIGTFIRENLDGRLAGVPLLFSGDPLPLHDPFVVAARGPRELKRVIEGAVLVPRTDRGDEP